MKFKKLAIKDAPQFYQMISQMDYLIDEESINFFNLVIWNITNTIFYSISDEFICIKVIEQDKIIFLKPIASRANLQKPLIAMLKIKNPLMMYNVHQDLIEEILKNNFQVKKIGASDVDNEFFYNANQFKSYAGKSLQKKRNLMNRFKKNYQGRWFYKTLIDQDETDLINLLNQWKENRKQNNVNYSEIELKASQRAIEYFSKIKNAKAGAIYIDDKLSGFTIGFLIKPDLGIINVEKANSKITGLYQTLASEFIKNEFPKIKILSREDSAGIKNLYDSKLSYRPRKIVKKYDIQISN